MNAEERERERERELMREMQRDRERGLKDKFYFSLMHSLYLKRV